MVEKFFDGRIVLYQGNCLDVLAKLPENSIDSACIDPPYHLTSIVKRFGKPGSAPVKTKIVDGQGGSPYARTAHGFMGKQWDGGDIAFQVETWQQVYRVLKPGAHAIMFGGTRTFHRLVCAIEDAGFDVREMLTWVTGQNFPKSINVSRVIDKRQGLEGDVVRSRKTSLRDVGPVGFNRDSETYDVRAAVSDEAKHWEGWGTALKNSMEPICLVRKPLAENTIVDNVLEWGTGAINIDGCRVGTESVEIHGYKGNSFSQSYKEKDTAPELDAYKTVVGRWPPNVLLDTSEEVQEIFPETHSGLLKAGTIRNCPNQVYGKDFSPPGIATFRDSPNDSGTAARFFPQFDRTLFYHPKAGRQDRIGTKHPTVKPVTLLRWLVRLITPPGGTVLDCFAGTGTTGQAAIEEGFNAVLIEREDEYCTDIRKRMKILARQAPMPDNRPVDRKYKNVSTLEDF